MIGIYLIINCINNKAYVGSSIDIDARWFTHISFLSKNKHSNKYLQNAWNKYGADAFHFCIVEECLEDDLISIEQLWINAYKYKCYNLSDIADRYKISEETKSKISASLIGRKHTEETKKKMSLNYNKNIVRSPPDWSGKRHSEESKKKISESLRRKALDRNLNLIKCRQITLSVG